MLVALCCLCVFMLLLCCADKATPSVSEVWLSVGLAAGLTPGSAAEHGGSALQAFHRSAAVRDAGFEEHLLRGAKPFHSAITESP